MPWLQFLSLFHFSAQYFHSPVAAKPTASTWQILELGEGDAGIAGLALPVGLFFKLHEFHLATRVQLD